MSTTNTKEDNPKRKIFFGWWTVIATFIMDFWSTSRNYAFGVYVKPLIEEFGWTRAETSIANSLGSIEGGIEGPFGGIATDKYGPRAVTLAGTLVAGLGFFAMYFVNSLWMYIVIWGLVVSSGFNLGFMQPLNTAIANWFVKKRGTALGLSRMGTALGGTFIPAFMTWQIYTMGWRMSFIWAGVITLAIGLPLCWFCVKPHRPEYYGLLPDGETVDTSRLEDSSSLIKVGQEYSGQHGEYEFTTRQALRNSSFWLITLSATFVSSATNVIFVHLVPYLTDIGMDPLTAATALGLMTAVSAPCRAIGGWFVDRTSIERIRYVTALAWVGEFVGIYLIAFPINLTFVYIGLIIRGIGLGMHTGSRPPTLGRYFGRKSFGTVDGIRQIVGLPVRVVMPIFAGYIFDVTGTYNIAFITVLVFILTGIGLVIFAKAPKKPEILTDVTDLI